nr:putative reverse transcriptase domain-containing protein [Tanacetum cinerariifolium]
MIKSILDGFALGSFGQGGAVVKVLSSSGVAPYCDDTIKDLEAKHPYKLPPSMLGITFSEPPLVAEINSVFSCIKSFPKGTLCGRDGLRAQPILDALCGEEFATATDLLKVITSVVNLWLAWRCPPILAEFVASAPPMPLLKPDNGIQPIAAGTIWRRLVSKVAMKGVGDAEAILHSVNQVLSEYHNDGSLAMLTMDFSNAFNLVDRSALLHEVRVKCPFISLSVDFLYGQASRLYIGDKHIWSATEVQQGDPLRPLLFALILHPLLHTIKDSCKLLIHAWCLNDGTVIGDSEEVARVFECLRASHAQYFLLAIPIDGLGQHMSPVEYRTILKCRLMIPLFLVDAICPVCRKACLDSFEEHAVHCKEISGFKYRHDMGFTAALAVLITGASQSRQH